MDKSINKTFFFDGASLKSIGLEEYPESAWTYLSGDKPNAEMEEVYKKVAWLSRAIKLRTTVTKKIPFAIINKSGEDFDTSDKWENNIGCMPNPRRLIHQIEESLIFMNRAYLIKESNESKIVKNLKYIIPASMKDVIDPIKGLTGFERMATSNKIIFPLDKIIYFYVPSSFREVGYNDDSPAQAALQAAQVLYSMDVFANLYIKRGMIKATIITLAGNPTREERERVESWWNEMIMGIKNANKAKVFNADSVKAEQVGDGLEVMQKNTLVTSWREEIATALGIPQSILASNAANYATAQVDMRSFIENTIMPDCELIQDTFNEQLLDAMNLRMEFRPENMNEFQEDEAQRAGAYATYIASGMKPSIAAQMVGLELPQGIEYDMLDEQDIIETTPLDEELKKWQRKSINSIERGKSPAVKFDSTVISQIYYERIKSELKDCKNSNEIKAVFSRNKPKHMDVAQLIKSLQDATEALAVADGQ